MVLRAEPAAGERVLEPEFGDGRILKALKLAAPDALITGIELNDERFLAVKNDSVLSTGPSWCIPTFLGTSPMKLFDVIVMNPPFLKRSDVKHVMHAIAMLAKRGRLQAILSAGVLFREDTLTKALRERVKQLGGQISPLPDDTFRSPEQRSKQPALKLIFAAN